MLTFIMATAILRNTADQCCLPVGYSRLTGAEVIEMFPLDTPSTAAVVPKENRKTCLGRVIRPLYTPGPCEVHIAYTSGCAFAISMIFVFIFGNLTTDCHNRTTTDNPCSPEAYSAYYAVQWVSIGIISSACGAALRSFFLMSPKTNSTRVVLDPASIPPPVLPLDEAKALWNERHAADKEQ